VVAVLIGLNLLEEFTEAAADAIGIFPQNALRRMA
jgi:hypothetical protein